MAETTTETDLVAVSHPTEGTDLVPIEAALALEAQNTGWKRDTKAQIDALIAERDALQAKVDELTAAAKAEQADTPKGRKSAAAKAEQADTPPEEG